MLAVALLGNIGTFSGCLNGFYAIRGRPESPIFLDSVEPEDPPGFFDWMEALSAFSLVEAGLLTTVLLWR